MRYLCVIAILLTTFGTSSASTWYVDGSVLISGKGTSWKEAFKKIQEGIDAAAGKDTVIVAEGTYTERIQFAGKNITLTGTDPLDFLVASKTIIDGKKGGSVVTFLGTEDKSCILTGFTIRNGSADRGGGIRGNGALAAIRNNIITGNSATDSGGGLYGCSGTIQSNMISTNSADRQGGAMIFCSGTIQNNTITNNHSDIWGGGLDGCHGTIQNNTIRNNSASTGGGLSHCNGTIRNNTISSNSAGQDGGGLSNCEATVEGNTIAANSADGNGGGLFDCSGPIRNNTISGNAARGSFPSGNGGGLHACGGDIEDNTISGNSANGEGGGLAACDGTIQNNIIRDNEAPLVYPAGNGGGLAYCDGTIRQNQILGNSAGNDGGGLRGCAGLIEYNTICGNTATLPGGGLAYCNGTIQNNIIAANAASRGGGLSYCDGAIRNNTITGNSSSEDRGDLYDCRGTIRNCIIWGNTGENVDFGSTSVPTYSCVKGSPPGTGNISSDPRFVDRDGPDNDPETYEDNDYHLSPGSPCIDTGNNLDLDPPGFDFDGNLRIAFGEHSVTVDMGVYEYNSGTIEIRRVLPLAGGGVRLLWRSQPRDTYTVWSRSDLKTGTWVEEASVRSEGSLTPWRDTAADGQTKFYRIELK
jgi:hypothetical protein